MRYYKINHAFYCGVDLHARTMYLHVLDHLGVTVFDRNLAASPEAFLNAIAPFREGLVVGCECMFAWYWLADLCEDHDIPFVLGHPPLTVKLCYAGNRDEKLVERFGHAATRPRSAASRPT